MLNKLSFGSTRFNTTYSARCIKDSRGSFNLAKLAWGPSCNISIITSSCKVTLPLIS